MGFPLFKTAHLRKSENFCKGQQPAATSSSAKKRPATQQYARLGKAANQCSASSLEGMLRSVTLITVQPSLPEMELPAEILAFAQCPLFALGKTEQN